MAQGSNMALEDAATLASLLTKSPKPVKVSEVTKSYERLRQLRVAKVKQEVLRQGRDFKLPDGPEQRVRDEQFAHSLTDSDWCHPKGQPWIWGYDASQVWTEQ
jgi:salicylate hydroxylase